MPAIASLILAVSAGAASVDLAGAPFGELRAALRSRGFVLGHGGGRFGQSDAVLKDALQGDATVFGKILVGLDALGANPLYRLERALGFIRQPSRAPRTARPARRPRVAERRRPGAGGSGRADRRAVERWRDPAATSGAMKREPAEQRVHGTNLRRAKPHHRFQSEWFGGVGQEMAGRIGRGGRERGEGAIGREVTTRTGRATGSRESRSPELTKAAILRPETPIRR